MNFSYKTVINSVVYSQTFLFRSHDSRCFVAGMDPDFYLIKNRQLAAFNNNR